MQEVTLHIQQTLQAVCLIGLASVALVWCALQCAGILHRAAKRLRSRQASSVLGLIAVGLTIYGGAKHGIVEFPRTDGDTQYLQDRGSYVATNDHVHIDFTTVVIPPTANLFVDYREVGNTNEDAWVELWTGTIQEFNPPRDLQIANATNYDYVVYSDWTPGPSVQTNGVWHTHWGKARTRPHIMIPMQTRIILNDEEIASPPAFGDDLILINEPPTNNEDNGNEEE